MPPLIIKLIATMVLLTAHVFTMIMYILVFLADVDKLLLVSVIATPICIGLWIVIWRTDVRRSRRRVASLIVGSIGMTAIAAIIASLIMWPIEWSTDWKPIAICASWAYFYLWIAAALWCCLESRAERIARLTVDTSSASSTLCPNCRYDMTGLREAKCPECGATFTLDQLHRAWRPDHAILSERSTQP